jgi:hypothetical protein
LAKAIALLICAKNALSERSSPSLKHTTSAEDEVEEDEVEVDSEVVEEEDDDEGGAVLGEDVMGILV